MLSVLITLASGCAAWSRHATAEDHLTFLSQALDADARTRETLWRDFGARATGGSDDALLRVALLQSLPNHSGYDAAAARVRLDALASRNPVSVQVAAMARLRLAEMGDSAECRDEVAQLKQRLARVVEIERRMNQEK